VGRIRLIADRPQGKPGLPQPHARRNQRVVGFASHQVGLHKVSRFGHHHKGVFARGGRVGDLGAIGHYADKTGLTIGHVIQRRDNGFAGIGIAHKHHLCHVGARGLYRLVGYRGHRVAGATGQQQAAQQGKDIKHAHLQLL